MVVEVEPPPEQGQEEEALGTVAFVGSWTLREQPPPAAVLGSHTMALLWPAASPPRFLSCLVSLSVIVIKKGTFRGCLQQLHRLLY